MLMTIPPALPEVVYSIGHSNRTLTDFFVLLQAHGVICVVDIRTMPRSHANPQFNRDTFPAALGAQGIGYMHSAGMGSLRHTCPDSPNGGWRNLSFRGYADYMQTPEFAASLNDLLVIGGHERCALMCAEAVPWRCHRSLVADALLVRGISVVDILSLTRTQAHHLTPFARVEGTHITYPPTTFNRSILDEHLSA